MIIWALLLVIAGFAPVGASLPHSTVSYVHQLPSKIHFFPNTSNVLFQNIFVKDDGQGSIKVHLRTQDSGKEWEIEGLGKEPSHGFTLHPFDKQTVREMHQDTIII